MCGFLELRYNMSNKTQDTANNKISSFKTRNNYFKSLNKLLINSLRTYTYKSLNKLLFNVYTYLDVNFSQCLLLAYRFCRKTLLRCLNIPGIDKHHCYARTHL